MARVKMGWGRKYEQIDGNPPSTRFSPHILTSGSILISARSNLWSMSLTVALYWTPLWSSTWIRCRLVRTWALVTMSPSSDTMNPEPLDAGISSPLRGDLSQQDNSRSGGQGSEETHPVWEPLVYRAHLQHSFLLHFTFPCLCFHFLHVQLDSAGSVPTEDCFQLTFSRDTPFFRAGQSSNPLLQRGLT